ncbi:glutathione S-transferase family protein [Lysobacter niastensis]|uniref:glutathione transferase n=1 Tax=Lysobacter niastensis TaxID=380629 RepID=A0ABS0BAL5_9GAMM|nr:glutathione S-transferase family protein [Lysobacter niastensis]MBF6024892.1 glutathione S-transferase family protein [Lysobacter niastensis]
MSRHILVSHVLCPYVQRAAIVLDEKCIDFERRDIDLSAKPDWFLALSPTGKTPLLLVNGTPIFESSVICEYLDDTQAPRLHPDDPLQRARHRAWMEFASSLLSAIAALYSAADEAALARAAQAVRRQLEQIERALGDRPYFAGERFSIVDAAFAPALRYFEVIDEGDRFAFFLDLPKLASWRARLAERRSVRRAVSPDYREHLRAFVLKRGGALGARLADSVRDLAIP